MRDFFCITNREVPRKVPLSRVKRFPRKPARVNVQIIQVWPLFDCIYH